tara:strand:- start:959 stop:1159 length:201 start_codon:yes stop_codon:yes gene_type:complete
LDTIIDTNQAHELSEIIQQTIELVNKDKKELVVVYIIDFNIFEAVPAKWCDQKFEGWKEIVRVCAG